MYRPHGRMMEKRQQSGPLRVTSGTVDTKVGCHHTGSRHSPRSGVGGGGLVRPIVLHLDRKDGKFNKQNI